MIPPRPSAETPTSRRSIIVAGGLLVLAGLVVYANSLSGAFVFDDLPTIVQNPSLRPPWSAGALLSPPASATAGGRPLVNVSLALNFAMGGMDVRGYHAVNLVIHMLAALALFGVVRRTLVRPLGGDAGLAALAIAVLWTVHPLQTESVTYVVQRAESLMGLFYLMTVYCFIRGAEYQEMDYAMAGAPAGGDPSAGASGAASGRWRRWYALSVAACLLGMASKEVMVSAPVIVLLYDRTFVAGSFREAWRRRRWVHAGLGATWLVLGYLVASLGGNRGGSTGAGHGVTFLGYALTQFPAVAGYLKLSVWPHPLVFDYGAEWVAHGVDVVPAAAVLALLAGGTLYGLKRRPVLGFAGAWFFAILAPSSLIPGPRQTMAEHRMYLALAVVVSLGVLAAYAWGGRRTLFAWFAVALGLGWLTVVRNGDYRNEASIWGDTVAKRPGNAWARINFGTNLLEAGRLGDATAQFEAAVRIGPGLAEAHNNLGNALAQSKRLPEALQEYRTALRLDPDSAAAHNNLGTLLARGGRLQEAMTEFQAALHLKPEYAKAHNNLGNALAQSKRLPEAVEQYEQALRTEPDMVEAHFSLGGVLLQLGRVDAAREQFEQTLRLRPDHANARAILDRLRPLPGSVDAR